MTVAVLASRRAATGQTRSSGRRLTSAAIVRSRQPPATSRTTDDAQQPVMRRPLAPAAPAFPASTPTETTKSAIPVTGGLGAAASSPRRGLPLWGRKDAGPRPPHRIPSGRARR